MTTEELLLVLDRTRRVPAAEMDRLRQLHAHAAREFSPRIMMKWLVHRGVLSQQEADRLLEADFERELAAAPPPPSPPPLWLEEELSLAPLDDDTDPQIVVDDEETDVEVLEEPSAPPQPVGEPAAPVTAELPPLPRRSGLEELFDEIEPAAGHALPRLAEMEAVVPSRRGPRWDSPLMLLGGGALLGLVILGTFLVLAVNRETGEQLLESAESAYREGAYSQAISRFDRFLQRFPRHEGASRAQVQRGLARLRQATERGEQWEQALKTAQDVLAEIAGQREFERAQADLSVLLPSLAEALAREAAAHPEPDRIAMAEQALELANSERFVPESLRPRQRLADAAQDVGLALRQLDKARALESTVAAIRQAADQRQPQAALQARQELLRRYPDLADDNSLNDAAALIARAEQQAARYVAEPQPAVTTPADAVLAAECALVSRRGGQAAAEGVACVAADGHVFALEASSGRVLWHYFVGLEAENPPLASGSGDQASVVFCDEHRNEVVRLDARSGQLQWRHKLAAPGPVHLTLAGDRVLAASRSGRLLAIDLASGASAGYTELPQPLTAPPATDARRRLYYQVAEQSHLYVVEAATGACVEVFPMGHQRATIPTAPLAAGRFLIVAENNLARAATLHVLAADADGRRLRTVQRTPVSGHLLSPPQVSGRLVFLATDAGVLYLFELAADDHAEPLNLLAERVASSRPDVIRYAAALGGQLWLAGDGLTRFDVQALRGRVAPAWTVLAGDICTQPPLVAGSTVVCVRRRSGLPGVAVAAVDAASGDTRWETHLAASAAGPAALDPSTHEITVANALGDVFRISADTLADTLQLDAPVARAAAGQPRPADRPPAVLPGGGMAYLAAADSDDAAEPLPRGLVLVDRQPQQTSVRWLHVAGAPAAPPVAWQGGLLVPLDIGQVLLVDPVSGRDKAAPFQPSLEVGSHFQWSRPIVTPDDCVLLADGRARLYRLAYHADPEPRVTSAAEAALASPPAGPIALLGDAAFLVDQSARLLSFALPDLAPQNDWTLDGRPQWGPVAVGDRLLLATGDRLYCLDSRQQLAWQVSLPHGLPLGAIASAHDHLLLATVSGTVYRIAAASGDETAAVDTGRLLAGGPLALENRLLLVGADGFLYVVSSP